MSARNDSRRFSTVRNPNDCDCCRPLIRVLIACLTAPIRPSTPQASRLRRRVHVIAAANRPAFMTALARSPIYRSPRVLDLTAMTPGPFGPLGTSGRPAAPATRNGLSTAASMFQSPAGLPPFVAPAPSSSERRVRSGAFDDSYDFVLACDGMDLPPELPACDSDWSEPCSPMRGIKAALDAAS